MTKKERNARRRIAYHLRRAMRLVAGRPMRWGVDDCSRFHCDVNVIATGVDPAAGYRYQTEDEARELMGKGGLMRTVASAFRKLGWYRIDPKEALVGDVGIFMGMFRGKPGASIVRCLHRGEWVGRNEHGWSIITTKDIKAAWRIVLP